MSKRQEVGDVDMMDDDLQPDYADPVIVKPSPLKTPEDALRYWNQRLETVS